MITLFHQNISPPLFQKKIGKIGHQGGPNVNPHALYTRPVPLCYSDMFLPLNSKTTIYHLFTTL